MPALAYFITFSTYGARLHGQASGSVDRDHNTYGTPVLPVDPTRCRHCRDRMAEEPDFLDQDRRQTVLNTIVEVLQYRGWHLWAAHVRSNHVHLAVAAEQKPEKVMSDVKAWCSRRLRERHGEPADRTRWTQHGSTKYLMTEEEFHAAVRYILQFQGEPMAVACDPAIEYLGTADAVVPDGSRKR